MSLVKSAEATFGVLAEVAAERVRQDAKWGQQDHPCVDEPHIGKPGWIGIRYGIIGEAEAKRQCETAFAAGCGTYADIAIEEVAEAVCAEDDAKRRAELVQCAAVFVAWIEAIDRRNARALDSVSMDPPALPSAAGVTFVGMTGAGLRRLEADLAVMA